MPQSDEAGAWSAAVYEAVQEVPYGKVTTYGHIARLVGNPSAPRQVGQSLKHLPSLNDQPDAYFHDQNVPWQRVINSKGQISPRSQPSGASRQAAALEQEGVTIERSSMGELSIDLTVYGWFPDELPSETR